MNILCKFRPSDIQISGKCIIVDWYSRLCSRPMLTGNAPEKIKEKERNVKK